jgi:NhaP-type Na+/H+ or K+/H+ antiporter
MGGFHEATLTVAFAMIVGVASSVLGERLRLPSLFFYLLCGVALGPSGIGFLHPDALGHGLEGLVSLGVAIILFEGAIELDFSHIRAMRKVIRNLLTIGVVITLCGGAIAAFFLANMRWELALLFGAVMTVTGPTVIRPILRRVSLKKPIGAILHWEAILVDPIGAIVAVFLFEFAIAGRSTPGISLLALGQSIVVGSAIGVGVGLPYAESLRRGFWSQGEQRNIGAIAAALLIYALSEYLSLHSGLIAVVVGGLAVGWRAHREREEILRFKGTVVTLLLSTLFVLLSANLVLQDIYDLGTRGLLVVAVMIFIVRPLAVFVSTGDSNLQFREKLFLAWVAPKGIIAASIASLFTFTLRSSGWEDAGMLESLSYLMIGATVSLQGFPAGLVARLLRVKGRPRTGFLLVGANALSRGVARWLTEADIDVRLVDTDLTEVMDARQMGLIAYYGNAIDEQDLERVDLQDIGNLLALTSNDEVNILACQLVGRHLGREHIWRIGEAREVVSPRGVIARKGGRRIFPQLPPIETVIADLQSENARLEGRRIEHESVPTSAEQLDRELPLLYRINQTIQPVYEGEAIPKGADALYIVWR